MPRPNSTRLAVCCALAPLLLAIGSGCLGTPLPDPPSFSGDAVTLSEGDQPGTVRLVGDAGAVREGGATLRVTVPPAVGVLVATNADGSFGRVVPGMLGDRMFFELVLATEDRFVGAFAADLDMRLHAVDPGPDGDGDGSPDAIDCAPADGTVGGQRCAPAAECTADSDCGGGQVCNAGVCVVGTTCRDGLDCGPAESCVAGFCRGAACAGAPETCNGVDDDCNGLIDDGDPGGGIACTDASACSGVLMCTATPALECVPTPVPEICGNAIDDDCDATIDEPDCT